MNLPPLTTNPGVPWYDLWPLQPLPDRRTKSGQQEKPLSVVESIAKRYPTDSDKHILILSVARKLEVNANSTVEQVVILPESGRMYLLQAILVSYLPDLEISFATPDRRLIVDRGNVSAFTGGLPGKSWIEYKYLIPAQSPLSFTFRNTSAVDLVVDCATLGQSVKGEV